MYASIRNSVWLGGILALFAAPAAATSVSQLAWLAGCWASENAEPGSGEQWMQPAAGTMLGASRTVRAGRTIAHEFMQIREVEAGGLVFIAHPSGQRETRFPLLRLSTAEVVFENPDHDFPRRIIYRLEQGGSLQAAIEGVRDDRLERMEFPMRRVSCELAPDSQAGIRAPAMPR